MVNLNRGNQQHTTKKKEKRKNKKKKHKMYIKQQQQKKNNAYILYVYDLLSILFRSDSKFLSRTYIYIFYIFITY